MHKHNPFDGSGRRRKEKPTQSPSPPYHSFLCREPQIQCRNVRFHGKMVLNECIHNAGHLLHINHLEHKRLQWQSDKPRFHLRMKVNCHVWQVPGLDGLMQIGIGAVLMESQVGL